MWSCGGWRMLEGCGSFECRLTGSRRTHTCTDSVLSLPRATVTYLLGRPKRFTEDLYSKFPGIINSKKWILLFVFSTVKSL